MHSYESENGTIFHHNSDFSGDVIIITPEPNKQKFEISGKDILEFVTTQYILTKRISMLEQMDWKKLITL